MPKTKPRRKGGEKPFVSSYRRKQFEKSQSGLQATVDSSTPLAVAEVSLVPVAPPVAALTTTPSLVVLEDKQEPQFPKVRSWRDFGELIRALNNARDNPQSSYYLGQTPKR